MYEMVISTLKTYQLLVVSLRGSILRPLLFIIYINNITKLSSIMEFILFANDINIFMGGSDLYKSLECVNSELEKNHLLV